MDFIDILVPPKSMCDHQDNMSLLFFSRVKEERGCFSWAVDSSSESYAPSRVQQQTSRGA